MHVLRRLTLISGMVCVTSGAFAMTNQPAPLEQIKKELFAEKEQWAYVQKS
jgi:hypothetical protein